MAEDGAASTPQDGASEDNKPEYPRDAAPWLKMITNAEKAFEFYHMRCDNIGKIYANLKKLAGEGRSDREFQMFYANLEVLKPSIYARAPQPVVVQRFKDSGKAVARKTGEVLERALISSFDTEKVHDTLKLVRDNLAMYARGVIWNRYEAEYPDTAKAKECVRYEWIHRKDFLHEPARCWQEVGWVARGTWLTKEQGEKRFGEAWKQGEITYEDSSDTAEEYQVDRKARVWELWHRGMNLVVWLHPNAKDVLDIAPPHINIEGFFPCPKPAYGTCEPDSLIPVPDMLFYKDQLEEINELTARISALSESLKLLGFYPGGVEDLGSAIEHAIQIANQGENRRILLPLPNFSAFGGAGSLKDSVVWLPVVEVANTVVALVQLRKQLIDDVYQISGISDIMRGQTEASETLGAQQLKSQYGSIRIKDRQGEMIRICDGTLNIAGEIMAENFAPETLMSMSQTELPKQADVLAQHTQAVQAQIAQMAQQAQQQGQPFDPKQAEPIVLKAQQEAEQVVTVEKVFTLLRSEKLRPFALMIATDSTIQPDENAEKAARSEFLQALSVALGQLGPMVASQPETAPFAGELLKFSLEPFRAGRQMAQSIEDFVEQVKEKAKQPPPPNPEAEAMKMDMELKKADLEDRQAERQSKAQQQQTQAQMDAQKAQQEADRAAMEGQQKQADMARDAMLKDREMQARLAEIDRKAAADLQKYEHEKLMQATAIRLAELQVELAEVKLAEARSKPKPSNGSMETEHGHS